MAAAGDGGEGERALSAVLDRLEAAAAGETVSVGEIAAALGRRSFPALILGPALIAVSPASGIPGVTSAVGLVVAATVAQALLGRETLWLPRRFACRRIDADRLARGVRRLRGPVGAVERLLRPRLSWLVRRPLVALPLLVMLAIGLAMPLLEFIPTSGSVAAAAISVLAAGLLARDGLVVAAGLAVAVAVPYLIWQVVT
jgi:hypothetical protein